MDDVLFRSYSREQEEQPEDQVIFPSLEEPVYGPRRYPEGPATFTPGLRPTPPSRESLPPPEGAVFTPMPTQEPQQKNPFQQFLDFIGITSADYGRVMRELGAQATSQFERSAEVGEQVGSSVMSRYFLGEFPESAEEATWDNFFMNQYMQYAPEGTTEEELQPYVDAAANRAALFQYEPLDLVLGDAADAARVAAPALGLIAPGNLMRWMKTYKDVEFVPARVLAEAQGNRLRRTPEEMEQLRAEIMANPQGIDDPIKVMFDNKTGEWFVGEGNHRVALAVEENLPLPVVVMRGRAPEYANAQPVNPAAAERLKAFADANYGYIPSNFAPSDIGIPVVSIDEVVRYTDARAAAGEVPADEAAAFREFAATYQPQYKIPGTTPIGPVSAAPDPQTPELNLFMEPGEDNPLTEIIKMFDAEGVDYEDIDPELIDKATELFELSGVPYVERDLDLPFPSFKDYKTRRDELKDEIKDLLIVNGLTSGDVDDALDMLTEPEFYQPKRTQDVKRLNPYDVVVEYGNEAGERINRAIKAYTGWESGVLGGPFVSQGTAANQFSQSLVDQFWSTRSKTEPQTFGYAILNSYLRNPNQYTLEPRDAQIIDSWISDLDAAFNGPLGRTTEDAIVYRGMLNRPGRLPLDDPDALIGTIVSDDAYSSFSGTAYPAMRFMREKSFAPLSEGASRVLWRVEIPQGSQALHIAQMSDIPREQEVLLPRNAQIEITGVTQRDNYTLITGRYVGTGD